MNWMIAIKRTFLIMTVDFKFKLRIVNVIGNMLVYSFILGGAIAFQLAITCL